ncbi:C40 family peptidase [Phytohalomonas tamaricis]|uniref:C40 family peptidase n=1 Tax=Phytohalomonas tamaricis TaxID=2081032 RepID=UPI000D0B3E21|nr:C40 family peptidase [Phytohalomonas tamaricis]
MRFFVLFFIFFLFSFLPSVPTPFVQKAFAHSHHLIQPAHGTKSELRARRLREKRAEKGGSSSLPLQRSARQSSVSLKKKSLQHTQKRQQEAIATLLDQLGKPYLWGGTSPHAGFDCSGLIYYAYRNLLSIPLPRTADEMYRLEEAPLVGRNNLKRGDLVFFQIHTLRAADHVGVYLGNGKFIQAPRTGANIRISSINSAYWDKHYLGARRLITQYTVR